MDWLIKSKRITNCVTSSLRYPAHVRLANVIDSIYELERLRFWSSSLLANSVCAGELYRHKAK